MVATCSPPGDNTAPGARLPPSARTGARRIAARHGRPPPRPPRRDVGAASQPRRPRAFPDRPPARLRRPAGRPDPRGAGQAPEVVQEGPWVRGGEDRARGRAPDQRGGLPPAPAADAPAGLPSPKGGRVRRHHGRGGCARRGRVGRRRGAECGRRHERPRAARGDAGALRRRSRRRRPRHRPRGRRGGRVLRLPDDRAPTGAAANAAAARAPVPARHRRSRGGDRTGDRGPPVRVCRRRRRPALDPARRPRRRGGRHRHERRADPRRGADADHGRPRDHCQRPHLDVAPAGGTSARRGAVPRGARAGAWRPPAGGRRRHGPGVHGGRSPRVDAALPAGVGDRAPGRARPGDRRVRHPGGRGRADADVRHQPRPAAVPRPAPVRPGTVPRRGRRDPARLGLPALRRGDAQVHRRRLRDARSGARDGGAGAALPAAARSGSRGRPQARVSLRPRDGLWMRPEARAA